MSQPRNRTRTRTTRRALTRAVDLFSGWGGFTAGCELAGVDVVWAANHWPLAVEAHALNHPGTVHACQDLQQADFSELPAYDLLLASPSCQGHSSAARPGRSASGHVRNTHNALRATAWAVVTCAEVTRPERLIIENVPDFQKWDLYPVWLSALRKLGYQLQEVKARASELGVPQRRDRVFIIGTRSGAAPSLVLPRGAEPAFGPCIEAAKGATWRPIDERPRVHERILRSRKRHGHTFLTQHTRDHMGVPLDQPIRTITTKDQWALVRGKRYRPLTLRENARAMGFADSYGWPEHATRGDIMRGLGNAVPPPVARALVERVAGGAF